MKRASTAVMLVIACVVITACGERPQVANTATGVRKTDTQGFTGADPVYTAPGWKAGDEASWQQQLKQRAQAQNEYVRVGAKKSGS